MTTADIRTVKVGDAVEYVSTRGLIKLALVANTPATVVEGTELPSLTEGQVHLMVANVLKGWSTRLNVPSADSVADNEDFQDGDGNTVGVWRFPVA
jgi:hypothetical protein